MKTNHLLPYRDKKSWQLRFLSAWVFESAKSSALEYLKCLASCVSSLGHLSTGRAQGSSYSRHQIPDL